MQTLVTQCPIVLPNLNLYLVCITKQTTHMQRNAFNYLAA